MAMLFMRMLSVGYLSVDCFGLIYSGAVLSVESSLLSQNSLLTGKLTGKMNKNSCHLIVKSQFSLGQLILLPNLTGNLISENREF